MSGGQLAPGGLYQRLGEGGRGLSGGTGSLSSPREPGFPGQPERTVLPQPPGTQAQDCLQPPAPPPSSAKFCPLVLPQPPSPRLSTHSPGFPPVHSQAGCPLSGSALVGAAVPRPRAPGLPQRNPGNTPSLCAEPSPEG